MKPPMTLEERELAINTKAEQNDLFLVVALQVKNNSNKFRVVGCWKTFPEAVTHRKQAEQWLENEYDSSEWKENPFDHQFEGHCGYLIFMKKWGVN